MAPLPILLFIYGTLRPDRAPREIAHAVRRLKPVGPATGKATIRGRLLDLGEYPGLLLEETADSTTNGAAAAGQVDVHGELFEVPDADTLAQLDAYEGFHPGDPATSLFLRVEATATLADGSPVRCWVYVYNR